MVRVFRCFGDYCGIVIGVVLEVGKGLCCM